MADTPKLTDSQAAILRCVTADLGDLVVLTRSGMLDDNGRDITPLGRAALAAYDAEHRRRIRVEAMRECLAIVKMERLVAEQRLDAEDFMAFIAMDSIRDSIRALIAKEEA